MRQRDFRCAQRGAAKLTGNLPVTARSPTSSRRRGHAQPAKPTSAPCRAAKKKKQALSQELLRTTLEIPFSVPPYMSLLARSIATLEGIALLGDPNYQMVAQAYPFVVRKVLRNSTASVGTLLRDIVFDASTGAVKPTRLSALLNAALGFVADRTDGFVDLDAVPEDGASLQVRGKTK